jgi:hypothetical protein
MEKKTWRGMNDLELSFSCSGCRLWFEERYYSMIQDKITSKTITVYKVFIGGCCIDLTLRCRCFYIFSNTCGSVQSLTKQTNSDFLAVIREFRSSWPSGPGKWHLSIAHSNNPVIQAWEPASEVTFSFTAHRQGTTVESSFANVGLSHLAHHACLLLHVATPWVAKRNRSEHREVPSSNADFIFSHTPERSKHTDTVQ